MTTELIQELIAKKKSSPFLFYSRREKAFYWYDFAPNVVEAKKSTFGNDFYFIIYIEDIDCFFRVPYSIVNRFLTQNYPNSQGKNFWRVYIKDGTDLSAPNSPVPPISLVQYRVDQKDLSRWLKSPSYQDDISLHEDTFPEFLSSDDEHAIEEIEKKLSLIRPRPWQGKFRDKLLKHHRCCMATDCRVKSALESAHIRPHRQGNDNRIQNGLLLRADVHRLFDADLLGIDPRTGKVHIHESAKLPPYGPSISNRRTTAADFFGRCC